MGGGLAPGWPTRGAARRACRRGGALHTHRACGQYRGPHGPARDTDFVRLRGVKGLPCTWRAAKQRTISDAAFTDLAGGIHALNMRGFEQRSNACHARLAHVALMPMDEGEAEAEESW